MSGPRSLVFAVTMWFGITTWLGVVSGWRRLAARFPDRSEEPLLLLKKQSGRMGKGVGVSMNHILTLSACPGGLRVGIMRIFGFFNRDFFVPWEDISVVRKHRFYGDMAVLNFAGAGKLEVRSLVANRLARASQGRWTEPGPLPEITGENIFREVFKVWVLMTTLGVLFFTGVPILMAPKNARPPLILSILFPTLLFGAISVCQYFIRTKELRK